MNNTPDLSQAAGAGQPIHAMPAIDVHGHLGAYRCKLPMHQEFMSGYADDILRMAAAARTEKTVVSSLRALLPRGHGEVVEGNTEVVREVQNRSGLNFWAVLDPRLAESFAQTRELLNHPQCLGIKIHPEEHVYPIVDHARAVFEFAAEAGAVVLTHSGEQRSLPTDFVPWANEFPRVAVILAHLGFGWDQDYTLQVRAIQNSRHGNLFTDTSSSRSVTPQLIEWAVAEVGADKILYGTDTPLYYPPMMRARIDKAELNDEAKRLILRENACRLFGW